ncbi:MAG: pyridoxamine 5'-phosphate oxidase [Planctomycetota bacterium]|jgi:pyridoxamine 5'-phosphate oxidase
MVQDRSDYRVGSLEREGLDPDPLAQFRRWFDEAKAFVGEGGLRLVEPEAMALASVDGSGQPHVRMVLLREIRPEGLVFFTNYESDKGVQLLAQPRAALCFHWDRMERQVRVEGSVSPLTPEESDAYFLARPRKSRIASASSPQSRVVEDRRALQRIFEEWEARFEDGAEVPRPDHWGGFIVAPTLFEFWQGRRHRLHDRFRYSQAESGGTDWRIERLAP